MAKVLSDLLADIPYTVIAGNPVSTIVHAVTMDSRAVTPGALFFCIQGEKFDGHRFAGDAIQRGATALITEKPAALSAAVTHVIVADLRSHLAAIAARFYDEPSAALNVVGITGTNGKTTTAFALRQILETAGVRTGLLSTIGYYMPDGFHPATLTTPPAVDLQRYFADYRDAGCGAAVMEVSSHALALKRVDSVRFKRAVFTNLSRDHLDFHRDMEDYFQVKQRLFTMLPPHQDVPVPKIAGMRNFRPDSDPLVGAVNSDDAYGRRLLNPRLLSFGISAPAAVIARNLKLELSRTSYEIEFPGRHGTRACRDRIDVSTRLLGYPAVYNLLAAAACAFTLDISPNVIKRGLETLEPPAGRLQNVTPDRDFAVIVDYAHTPDGMTTVLSSLTALKPKRIITIFGCGGDRDRGKRPQMAREAEKFSDRVIVTSDNPRSEDPAAIIEEIGAGFNRPAAVLKIVDRREAIRKGLALLRAGDILLLAGKGHEDYQILGADRIHFSDREVALEELERLKN